MIDKSSNLLSSTDSNEDASVFKISDDLALVQTLDFITPVVDDPFVFGQIAAANSLSDIFAMGAKPLNALNIVGFDSCHFSDEILAEILAGGKSKISECGAQLVGGHSIQTPEMYYGLSVTGVVNPTKFWANNTAKVGDLLILTKPLGTGILSTAIKADFLSLDEVKEAAFYMSQLNFYALSALCDVQVHACTDITGFGFLGHSLEMIRDDIGFEIQTMSLPIIKSVQKCLDMGLIPAGSYRNQEFIKPNLNTLPDILLCDAQTSGGLLVAISEKEVNLALKRLKEAGYESAAIVGKVCQRKEHKIYLS
ncbi:selenide%2C water dikinase [Campylobacter geochelonis]|nr:selenide%2C water dikinase [Campylobacter geochelonis]